MDLFSIRLLFLVFSLSLVGADLLCGRGTNLDAFTVKISKGPNPNKYGYTCTGVMIEQPGSRTSDLILTSAFCVEEMMHKEGDYVATTADGTKIGDIQKDRHMIENAIGILTLKSRAQFISNVLWPLCLPEKNEPTVPREGYTFQPSTNGGSTVSANTTDPSYCYYILPHELCVSLGSTSVVNGAPYFAHKKKTNRYSVWGITNENDLNEQVNRRYVPVGHYLHLIKEYMNGDYTGWHKTDGTSRGLRAPSETLTSGHQSGEKLILNSNKKTQ